MQLTTKAQQTFNVLEELKRIYDDKIMHGAEGLEGQERASYLYECKHVQSCINIVQNRMYDSFAQEEIDDFYLEQHTNLERLQYTMQSILADDYLTFLTHVNNVEGLIDFNYANAENVAQQARQEGGHFADAYAVCVLEHLKELCIHRISNYDDYTMDSNCVLMCNADALHFCTKQLLKLR